MIMTLQDSNHEILQLLAAGNTYKEVAAKVGKKPRTIKQRIRNLKDKHHCTSVPQLLVKLFGLTKVGEDV